MIRRPCALPPALAAALPAALPTALLVALFAGCASTTHSSTVDTDGSRVRTFRTDGKTMYRIVLEVLEEAGYQITMEGVPGQSIRANSPIKQGVTGRRDYTIARFDLEYTIAEVTRVRIVLTRTWEFASQGRTPNNDRAVSSEKSFDFFFDQIEAKLAG